MNAIPNQRGQLRISLQYFVFMRQQLLIHFCKVHAILIARIAPIQDVPVSIIQKSVGVFHGEIIGIFKRYCLGRSIYDFDKAVFVIPDFTFSGFLNLQQMAAAIVDLACKGTVYVRINVNAALFAARINMDFGNVIFSGSQSVRQLLLIVADCVNPKKAKCKRQT